MLKSKGTPLRGGEAKNRCKNVPLERGFSELSLLLKSSGTLGDAEWECCTQSSAGNLPGTHTLLQEHGMEGEGAGFALQSQAELSTAS